MYNVSDTISHKELQERNALVRRVNRGRFWKPCPGTTKGYYCCGYQILTPLTGCGMYCSYCILQEYYDHPYQVLYENYDDLVKEVQHTLGRIPGVVRLGTGEFADSLYLEDTLGLSQKIAALLEPYPNVLVEFKTKSVNIEPLKNIANPAKVIIGFSMNTPTMIACLEKGTAPLSARIKAARTCEDMGFLIAFHFDPMVWYPQWKNEYSAVVDTIFNAIRDPQHIAWWSLGGFRTMPSLKGRLRALNRHLPLFAGEMVQGEDKKLRYFRPIRVDFYRTMQAQIEKYYSDITLYLCMESPEVWEESGMKKRIPRGLVTYLDERAEILLNLAKEQEN